MWYNNLHKSFGFRGGQTAVEYLLALCALIVVVTVSGYLLSAVRSSVVRTERLVSSEYP